MRRPDILDGLGIYVTQTEVALAYVAKRLLQVRLRAHHVAPLPGADRADERRQALTAAVAEFVRAHEVDTSHTVLCLPRADAAVTRVLLPVAARENLAQVLEYELENLLPIAREEVHYDYSVRPLGEERIEVLLLALPRAVLQGSLDALAAAEVRPRRVMLASTAVADYLNFCRGSASGALGVVLEATHATEIALVADGRLIASQLVPASRLTDAGALGRSLARQMSDEFLDPEQVTLHRWALDRAPAEAEEGDLRALARGRMQAADEFFSSAPSVLPAVGAALGAVREGTGAVNLLPAEQREAFDEGPSVVTWVLLAASVLLLVVWGASAIIKDVTLRNELDAQLEAIAPEVREVKQIQADVDEMEKQVELLGTGQDGRVTTLLKDLSDLIPPEAYLTTCNLRGARLALDGQAKSASDLITALEKSKRFRRVAFSSPTTRQGEKERFSITAEVVK